MKRKTNKKKNKMVGGSVKIQEEERKIKCNWLTMLLCIGLLFCVVYILLMNNDSFDEEPIHIINNIQVKKEPEDRFEEKLKDRLEPPTKLSDSTVQDTRHIYPPIARDMRVNIRTRGEPLEYQQVGILTNKSNSSVKPLYGRRTYNRSNHWNYYSSTDSNLSLKIPIFKNNRKCTDEQGCSEINDGDEIVIGNISDDVYIVTMYSNSDFQYIPYV